MGIAAATRHGVMEASLARSAYCDAAVFDDERRLGYGYLLAVRRSQRFDRARTRLVSSGLGCRRTRVDRSRRPGCSRGVRQSLHAPRYRAGRHRPSRSFGVFRFRHSLPVPLLGVRVRRVACAPRRGSTTSIPPSSRCTALTCRSGVASCSCVLSATALRCSKSLARSPSGSGTFRSPISLSAGDQLRGGRQLEGDRRELQRVLPLRARAP